MPELILVIAVAFGFAFVISELLSRICSMPRQVGQVVAGIILGLPTK